MKTTKGKGSRHLVTEETRKAEPNAGSGGSLLLSMNREAERTRSIEEAVKALLQGLGEDHEQEGLRRTPHRVAEAFCGGTRGYKQKAKDIVQGALFPEAGLNPGVDHAGGVGGLVVVRDIDLFSYCESCLLPFSIKCHVGYVPSRGSVVGLSKLSRVADVFARRFQDPKRLASEVCAALHNSINPASVAVSLQCWHMKFSHLCDTNFTHSTISDMQSWGTVLASSRSGVFKEGKNSLINSHPLIDEEDADMFGDRFSTAYSLDREFGYVHIVALKLPVYQFLCPCPRLKEHMEYCINHPEEMSKLSKLKAHITEVKGIMMDNIEKFTNLKYSRVEIDEVRFEWAEYMLDYI
ncbi:hypothetical protein ZIOFF_018448 [Zingiber officinale]|uniref:GTP cyclohydrolase 1 n=1 Tax=Zingiber officinale TaxID=94328 RepID=A0A8J5HGE9_ZINOF|nr:hypothetical protein ZIOFF_018448 [Zingiber officinale]